MMVHQSGFTSHDFTHTHTSGISEKKTEKMMKHEEIFKTLVSINPIFLVWLV